MAVSYVERGNATADTNAFYDKAEARFEMLLNIFKVFGHTPELGTVFTDMIMAILKDGELAWTTKEPIILKATHRNECQYCVVQHETPSRRLGISEEKINDIGDDRYKASPHFTDAEKALMDLTIQIGVRRQPGAGRALGAPAQALHRAANRRGRVHHHDLHRGQQVRRRVGRRARAGVLGHSADLGGSALSGTGLRRAAKDARLGPWCEGLARWGTASAGETC